MNKELASYLGFTIVAALFYLICERFFVVGYFDDSYISFRYAKNLLNGNGLVWNIGEGITEGFTNLGWVLLLAAKSYLSGSAIEDSARTLGILFGIGNLWLCWHCTAKLLNKNMKHWALIAPLHLLMMPYFVRQSVNGLETAAISMLITLCALLIVSFAQTKSHRFLYLLAILTVLCGLFRPESMLFGFSAGCLVALNCKIKPNRNEFSSLTRFVLTFGIFFVTAIGIKFSLMGTIVPLPAHQKTLLRGSGISLSLINFILGHWLQFLSLTIPLFLVAVLSFISKRRVHTRDFWAPSLAALLYFFYFLSVVPIMDIHLRFYFVFYPIFVIFASKCLIELLVDLSGPNLTIGLRAVALFLFVFIGVGAYPTIKRESIEVFRWHTNYGAIGKTLSDVTGYSAAMSEVGQFPYFSNWRVLDLSGLNDEFIAKNRFKMKKFDQAFTNYLQESFTIPSVYINPNAEYDYARMEKFPEQLRSQYQKVSLCRLEVFILTKDFEFLEPKISAAKC